MVSGRASDGRTGRREVVLLLGLGEPPALVVRSYGRDSLLLWLSPLLALVQSMLGLRIGLRSRAEVLERMERDVLAMQARGYRVAESTELELPVFLAPGLKATYFRVTYRRADGRSRPLG